MQRACVAVVDGDMPAATGRITRCAGGQSELIGEFETEPGQRSGLLGDRTDSRLDADPDALAGRGQPEHRWRAVEHPADSGARVERSLHCELVALCEPPPDRLREAVLDGFGDEHECRRAGSAVEELVRAADGQLDAGTWQVEFEDSGCVREIPDRCCADGRGSGGLAGEVGHLGGAVVDE